MFGDRLKELREEKKMTQDDLGKILNVSKQAVLAYEKGNTEPPLASLVKIADIFNVSLDYLLCRTKVRYNLAFNSDKEKLLKELNGLIDRYI